MKMRPVGSELFHADKHDDANSRIFSILRTLLKQDLCLQQMNVRAIKKQAVWNTCVIHCTDHKRVFFPAENLPNYFY